MILKPKNHAEWLKMRRNGIGGSDAGAVLGVNKYRSNVDVWAEKTGTVPCEDISDKPAVKFGKQAEAHIRELFKLENPDFAVEYHEFYMYVNDEHPYIYATLDGEITDAAGRRGILEIKTSTIQNPSQRDEWWDMHDKSPRIPDSYYAQCLHQLAATGWDFVILFAYLRSGYGDKVAEIIERRIERHEVEQEIGYLIERESEFWTKVQSKERPALILPKI